MPKLIACLFLSFSVTAFAKDLRSDVRAIVDGSMLQLKFDAAKLADSVKKKNELETCYLAGYLGGRAQSLYDTVSKLKNFPADLQSRISEVAAQSLALKDATCGSLSDRPEAFERMAGNLDKSIDFVVESYGGPRMKTGEQ